MYASWFVIFVLDMKLLTVSSQVHSEGPGASPGARAQERCPTLAPLLELVKNATQQMEKTTLPERNLRDFFSAQNWGGWGGYAQKCVFLRKTMNKVVKIVASRFYMVRIGDQNLIKATTNKHRG